MTELRRHPFIGEWVIICPEKQIALSDGASDGCGYCSSSESEDGFGEGALGKGALRIVPASPPLFNKHYELEKMPAGICDAMKPAGVHEVLIDSPSHEIAFEDLSEIQALKILKILQGRLTDLSEDQRLKYTFVFKVHKSKPHASHSCWQIVGTPFIPAPIKQELKRSRYYYGYKERCLLCDYIKEEISEGERIVINEASVVALAPYASRFPYEVWLLPRSHCADFRLAEDDEILGVGKSLRSLLNALRYINGTYGYIIGLHTAPYARESDAWKTLELDYHWHFEIRPMVDPINGLSASGGFHLNPISPEHAASRLRELM